MCWQMLASCGSAHHEFRPRDPFECFRQQTGGDSLQRVCDAVKRKPRGDGQTRLPPFSGKPRAKTQTSASGASQRVLTSGRPAFDGDGIDCMVGSLLPTTARMDGASDGLAGVVYFRGRGLIIRGGAATGSESRGTHIGAAFD
jgi:hypothetical protein